MTFRYTKPQKRSPNTTRTFSLNGERITFKKVHNSNQMFDGFLGDKPIKKLLVNEVKSWGKFSDDELIAAIEAGNLNGLIDWQECWTKIVNETLTPMCTKTMIEVAKTFTGGKIILSDSDVDVKAWLQTHGVELVTQLSDASKKAIANIIHRWQGELMRPREMAQQIRPLIGLTERQAQANANFREKIYERYRERGADKNTAAERADKAALKYASKQHRQRAETILHTELAHAYNRGAFIGVQRAISNGFMGRCEMIWKTSGTNRVCSRCMERKDKVVGHTDDSGVTLPPLHPRCRCTIKEPKPLVDETAIRTKLEAAMSELKLKGKLVYPPRICIRRRTHSR